jgi:hypothetical protein
VARLGDHACRYRSRVRWWANRASTSDPTASALAHLVPTHRPAWPAAIRLEASVTNIPDIERDESTRGASPAERAELAGLFEAIGNATNATILSMPDFSDETVRRQMVHTFASVGGFVMYADMLRQGTKPSETGPTDTLTAIIQLGRALSRRIEVKAS